eukprot:906167_1
MIFRLLLLLIIICIDSVASGKRLSIKCSCNCYFGSMDETSGPDPDPHFQRRIGNKTKVNKRETEPEPEPEPLERRRQPQPQQQRRLQTPVAHKNRLVTFNLSKVDDMSTLPESDGSDSTFESTTTSATTKRQTSFQPQSVSMHSLSFKKQESARSLPVVPPFGSQTRT